MYTYYRAVITSKRGFIFRTPLFARLDDQRIVSSCNGASIIGVHLGFGPTIACSIQTIKSEKELPTIDDGELTHWANPDGSIIHSPSHTSSSTESE